MNQPSVLDESYDSRRSRWRLPTWLKAAWAIGILLIVLLGGLSIGMVLERQRYEDSVVLDSSWHELGDVIAFLETDSYYRPDDAESLEAWKEELERRAIDGLLQASGDAYAAYLPPAEAAESSQRLTGHYEGIGVSIGEDDGGEVEIVSIMVDSPADRADVRVGDIVQEVEATPIPEGDVELASTLLRGSAGTQVSIQFGRPDADSYEVTLERERIATGEKTVGYRYFPEERVGVIQIAIFSQTTTGELDEALALAEEDGVERIVIDLRGNPGGWVSEAQKVIARFVDPDAGPALLEDTWPAGDGMVDLPINNGDSPRYSGDLIVLVDENTASAAEIVTSALQHYDRATVVGDQTFGKGSVQRVYDFPTGESLRLTVAEWFSPGGQRPQEIGVIPDVETETEAAVQELLPELLPAFDGDES